MREFHCSRAQNSRQTKKAMKLDRNENRMMSRTAHNSFVRGSIRASCEPLLMYCPNVISRESSIIRVCLFNIYPGRKTREFLGTPRTPTGGFPLYPLLL